MGKYLTNFKTKEEYEAFKAGGSYLTPNVSFIETAGSVINDSYQIQGGSASGYAPVLVGIPPDSGNFEEWGCIDFNAKKVWYFDYESYEVKEDTESVFDGNTLRLSLNGVKALTQIYGPAGVIHLTARMSRVFINAAMDLIHEDGSVASGPMDSPSGVFQSLIFTGDLGNKCYINSELDGSQYVIECNHSYEDVRNIL